VFTLDFAHRDGRCAECEIMDADLSVKMSIVSQLRLCEPR